MYRYVYFFPPLSSLLLLSTNFFILFYFVLFYFTYLIISPSSIQLILTSTPCTLIYSVHSFIIQRIDNITSIFLENFDRSIEQKTKTKEKKK